MTPNVKLLLALTAGALIGWILRGKAQTRLSGGAPPINQALLSQFLTMPALK